MVFADAPETQVPNKHDSRVLYYDVGVHDLHGQLALNSQITEVYLAPGAWVKGGFKITATTLSRSTAEVSLTTPRSPAMTRG